MSAVEHVVLRFLAPWEAADAAELTQRPELRVAPGQQLVDVGLVTRIPDDPVPWRLQDPVQRQSQLHDAERRAQMPARPRDGGNDALTDFGGQRVKFSFAEAAQVAGSLQSRQDCQLRTLLGGSPSAQLDDGVRPNRLTPLSAGQSNAPAARRHSSWRRPCRASLDGSVVFGGFDGLDLSQRKRSRRTFEELLNPQLG